MKPVDLSTWTEKDLWSEREPLKQRRDRGQLLWIQEQDYLEDLDDELNRRRSASEAKGGRELETLVRESAAVVRQLAVLSPINHSDEAVVEDLVRRTAPKHPAIKKPLLRR